MAINLAEKYSGKVAERFKKRSYTGALAGNAYEFDGVKSIKVYSVDTVPLVDYNRSASSNRYGTPAELNDFIQTMEMTQDKSFTYTIDKGNNKEQYNIKQANATLKRQIDERINPHLDTYNFEKWTAGAGQAVTLTANLAANNALAAVQDATELLDDENIFEGQRTLVCTAQFAKYVKQSTQFQYTDKLAQETLVKGQIGMLDGMPVVKVPSSYLPTGVHALVINKAALLAPMKIKDYKIHQDPPGINGDLVEGRILHDAFVLDAKAKGVVAILASTATHTAAPTVAANGAVTFTGATAVYYTVDGSDPRNSGTRATLSANGAATHTAGDTIRAIGYNASNTVAYSTEAVTETTS